MKMKQPHGENENENVIGGSSKQWAGMLHGTRRAIVFCVNFGASLATKYYIICCMETMAVLHA